MVKATVRQPKHVAMNEDLIEAGGAVNKNTVKVHGMCKRSF